LLEDGQPAQARLRALEDEELKQEPVVEDRHAPFPVVVGDVVGVAGDPGAALHAQAPCDPSGRPGARLPVALASMAGVLGACLPAFPAASCARRASASRQYSAEMS